MRLLLISSLLTVATATAETREVLQPSGKWCARVHSGNNDGYLMQCILVLTTPGRQGKSETLAFAWTEATCMKSKSSCGDGFQQARIERGPAPLRAIPGGFAFDENIPDKPLGNSKIIFGKRADRVVIEGGKEGNLPDGEEVVYKRDEAFGNFRPSFSCVKARQPREVAICASPSLSFLDQQLNITFERVLTCVSGPNQPRNKADIQKSQADWWSDKLSHCQNAECVAPLYRERIVQLNYVCAEK